MGNPNKAVILEPFKLDTSGAAAFGEIKYIYQNGEERPSIWLDEFCSDVMDRLAAMMFDPSRDVFVFAGQLIPMTRIAAALVVEYGEVQALFWSATNRSYEIITIGEPYED
jgi:hypothetical protein